MAIVKKGNRQLTVSAEAVKSYLAKGYDEIDPTGKVINNATGGKTISYAEHLRALADKDAKIKELEAKLAAETEAKKPWWCRLFKNR